jgi:hypothetical protein
MTIVTGPSLTSFTRMSAANTPRAGGRLRAPEDANRRGQRDRGGRGGDGPQRRRDPASGVGGPLQPRLLGQGAAIDFGAPHRLPGLVDGSRVNRLDRRADGRFVRQPRRTTGEQPRHQHRPRCRQDSDDDSDQQPTLRRPPATHAPCLFCRGEGLEIAEPRHGKHTAAGIANDLPSRLAGAYEHR